MMLLKVVIFYCLLRTLLFVELHLLSTLAAWQLDRLCGSEQPILAE